MPGAVLIISLGSARASEALSAVLEFKVSNDREVELSPLQLSLLRREIITGETNADEMNPKKTNGNQTNANKANSAETSE